MLKAVISDLSSFSSPLNASLKMPKLSSFIFAPNCVNVIISEERTAFTSASVSVVAIEMSVQRTSVVIILV